jgi:nicotinate-nucleotide pyrophosphorylase
VELRQNGGFGGLKLVEHHEPGFSDRDPGGLKALVERRAADLSSYPDLAVIYLGMRAYSLRGLFTVASLRSQVLKAVGEKPEGLLFHESFYFSLAPLHIGLRQYWRDFESLQRWTRALPHRGWWINIVQRMSGIATVTRSVQERLRGRWPGTSVVATRKTLWGPLDKRAVHLGGGGTHRIGLGDAILIKNNHLPLLAGSEEEAVPFGIARAWKFRKEAAFIEVEVKSHAAALAAAETFRRVQEEASERYPCLLMLDNVRPHQILSILGDLRKKGLSDYILIEASGGISEENVETYADTGVDAISMGTLTHSARALDFSQRIS